MILHAANKGPLEMSDLLALAERCEKATGADRELDLAIQCALSGNPWRWSDSRAFEPETVITWDQYGAGAVGNPVCDLEAYTASIDAAMTLVPEGWRVNWAGECPDRRWFVDLIARAANDVTPRLWAANYPLAICAAALRAHSITEGDRG